jgi:putative nucleotidyltransferase with HDIG domain
MLDEKLESKLFNIIKDSFINQEEKSGGIGYRYYHSIRVYNYCKRFLSFKEVKIKNPNSNVVLIAGLFHDIGRIKDKRKITTSIMPDHDEFSAPIAKELLKNIIEEETIAKVSDLLNNYKNENYLSIEKELVQYADNLDEIGALDVWRMFVFGTYNKESILSRIEVWKSFEKPRYGNEWLNKFKIKSIREIAERRINILSNFMDELEIENNSDDIKD